VFAMVAAHLLVNVQPARKIIAQVRHCWTKLDACELACEMWAYYYFFALVAALQFC
jgi:hypothetical protein